MKNQKKIDWKSRKRRRNKRINKKKREKMGKLKGSKRFLKVFLPKHKIFLQNTCRAMFYMFVIGTLKWEKKV